ncbi:MAG: leucyl/phenylalanyl-tRNA--protein transferase [Spirochaetota bacterium]
MPYLDESRSFAFPSVKSATSEGIIAIGGNLSPGMLLSAYRQGIFPWYSIGDPIIWWSPDPRCVIFPSELHVSRSSKKILRKGRFTATLDTSFVDVINSCKTILRPHQHGTWITEEMLRAYVRLHNLGYAHSIEVWDGDLLAGGLYGVSLGGCFFAESMFRRVSNASKIALIKLVKLCEILGFDMIDCQVPSPHLIKAGAREIPREDFINLLKKSLKKDTLKGNWGSSCYSSLLTKV